MKLQQVPMKPEALHQVFQPKYEPTWQWILEELLKHRTYQVVIHSPQTRDWYIGESLGELSDEIMTDLRSNNIHHGFIEVLTRDFFVTHPIDSHYRHLNERFK